MTDKLNIEILHTVNQDIKSRNMFVRKLFIVLVCMAISHVIFSQNVTGADSLLNNLKFDVISLKYKKETSYNLWGSEYKAKKILIKTFTDRVISSEPTKRKTFKEKYAIYVIYDKNEVFKDTLLSFIQNYLKQYEGHYLTSTEIASERNVIIDSLNSNFILYSYSRFRPFFDKPKVNDPEFVLWINNNIFCFSTIKKGYGLGNIRDFINQRVKVRSNNLFITISHSGLRLDSFIRLYNEGFFNTEGNKK